MGAGLPLINGWAIPQERRRPRLASPGDDCARIWARRLHGAEPHASVALPSPGGSSRRVSSASAKCFSSTASASNRALADMKRTAWRWLPLPAGTKLLPPGHIKKGHHIMRKLFAASAIGLGSCSRSLLRHRHRRRMVSSNCRAVLFRRASATPGAAAP
jgi:hypothetical protein